MIPAGPFSACEFTLGGWASGPALHLHEEVDEALYVVRGKLEAQLGDQRVQAETGGLCGCPIKWVRLTPEGRPGASTRRWRLF